MKPEREVLNWCGDRQFEKKQMLWGAGTCGFAYFITGSGGIENRAKQC